MRSLGEHQTHHAIAYQGNFGLVAIYIGHPISVLRNGGVQKPVPITGDSAGNAGGGKFRQGQGGGVEHLVAGPENLILQHGSFDGNRCAGQVGGAGDPNLYRITGLHIAHSQHLCQRIAFLIQLGIVVPDTEFFVLAQIQIQAQETFLGDVIGVD